MQKINKQNKLFIGNIKIIEIRYLHYSKKSKTNYYNQYFKANVNNIKNTWKGIKSIITIKNLSSHIPKSFSSNGSTIINQAEISNVFNNYFAAIAGKTKESINSSHKDFSDFPKNRHQNSFFLSPTNKFEINSNRFK